MLFFVVDVVVDDDDDVVVTVVHRIVGLARTTSVETCIARASTPA